MILAAPVSPATVTAINPAAGREIGSYALQDDAAIDAAVAVRRDWRRQPVVARIRLLSRMAAAQRAGKVRHAAMIVWEMGKPIAEAEIGNCARNCDFYAEHAPACMADEPVTSNATEA